MTFSEWLNLFSDHDSPTGDLARDYNRTKEQGEEPENSASSWRKYLKHHNASQEALAALSVAWSEYCQTVAGQECLTELEELYLAFHKVAREYSRVKTDLMEGVGAWRKRNRQLVTWKTALGNAKDGRIEGHDTIEMALKVTESRTLKSLTLWYGEIVDYQPSGVEGRDLKNMRTRINEYIARHEDGKEKS